MRKTLFAVIASLTLIAGAVPAEAQYHHRDHHWHHRHCWYRHHHRVCR